MQTPEGPADDQRLNERLMNLEMLFTHLERTMADLNTVLLEHGKRLDQLVSRLDQLATEGEEPDEEAVE